MAAEEKAVKATTKIIDVARPAGTQATSRPIIVGHGAIIRDPMMAPASWDEPGPTPKSEQPASSAEKITVNKAPSVDEKIPTEEPVDTEKKADSSTETSDDLEKEILPSESDEQDKQAPAEQDSSESLPAKTESTQTDTKPQKQKLTLVGKKIQPINSLEDTDNKTAQTDDLSPGPGIKDPPRDGEKPEVPQTDMIGALTVERMLELKNGKEYKVELGKGHGSQTSWAAIVLIVILIAIAIVVALDAGWIDIGMKLPFDFIK